MSPLLVPRTQRGFLALEQFRISHEDLEAEHSLGDQRACVLWMIARRLCESTAAFHDHFEFVRWIPEAVESLTAEGFLRQDSGVLGLTPSGRAALGSADPEGGRDGYRLFAGDCAYVLDTKLAAGAQGEVWLAHQIDPLARRVAIKLVAERGDRERNGMLFREAATMAAVAHAGIPAVIDTGVARDGRPFLVMEFVEGQPLDSFCDEHELQLEDRLALFLQTCAIVRHVHERGVLHRDIKPENLLVRSGHEPAVTLIDFGLALVLADEENEPGRVQGTPTHMSPEQASGVAQLDPRADVYGLGVILFELTTGLSPLRESDLVHAGEEIADVVGAAKLAPSEAFARAPRRWELAARRGTDAAALRSWLLGGLDRIIERAIAVDREQRYEAVESLASELADFLAETRSRPPGGGGARRLAVRVLWVVVVAALGFAAGSCWGPRLLG